MIMVVLKMIMVMMMKLIFGDDDDGSHFVGKKMVMMPIFLRKWCGLGGADNNHCRG